MRRLVVAELVLLAAAAAAFAVGLLLLLYLLCRRRRGSIVKRPLAPELPLSRGDPRPLPSPTKRSSCRVHQLLLMLCSGRRRARVEPASTPNSAEPTPAAEEEVAAWRERWFGPASRALYTIHEEDEVESTGGERREEEPETETPFYTPPASPAQLISAPAPAPEDAAS